jgi:hypothetical protein
MSLRIACSQMIEPTTTTLPTVCVDSNILSDIEYFNMSGKRRLTLSENIEYQFEILAQKLLYVILYTLHYTHTTVYYAVYCPLC